MIKTYGSIYFNSDKKSWIITAAEPHVCIKLKSNFARIPKTSTVPFSFPDTLETCSDLYWFMQRYPLQISSKDFKLLKIGDQKNTNQINELEKICFPDYIAKPIVLNDGKTARNYQLSANELLQKTKRYLLGDDLGLGKTITGILGFSNPGALPAAVVCQAHLTKHWEHKIAEFTSLKTHVISKKSAYSLPKDVDVYIFTYSKLSGWIDLFKSRYFKYAIFDEVQELRHSGTDKYNAADELSLNAIYVLGLSATPIYTECQNIYNILNLIKEHCLGNYNDFSREWATYAGSVKEPKALGSYLRSNFLFLRRTRAEVGMELPAINTIIHEIPYDHHEVAKQEDILRQLAIVITTGSFTERGEASREFDLRMRQMTGISKAKHVAAYVKILLDNNEPVLLFGWHRDVYDIWDEEFRDYKPAYFTGHENPHKKEDSKQRFINGETNLLIMSLRSGIGVDGLQYRCNMVVYGELDWSPQVHKQGIGRVDRDGQKDRVTAIFLVSEAGSDPVMIERLAGIASQSHNIIDPFSPVPEQFTDESRIKILAQRVLDKHGKT